MFRKQIITKKPSFNNEGLKIYKKEDIYSFSVAAFTLSLTVEDSL